MIFDLLSGLAIEFLIPPQKWSCVGPGDRDTACTIAALGIERK